MTAFARLSLATLALVAALVSVTVAAAGKGGASPGVALGGSGVATADGALRYVARQRAGLTTVTAIRPRRPGRPPRLPVGCPRDPAGRLRRLARRPRPRRRVARRSRRPGRSRDGLASPSSRPEPSRAADGHAARQLVVRRALARTAAKLYLVEHAGAGSPTYRVRAYDLLRGRLVREAVIDPRLGGRAMTGLPVTQAHGPGGVWAYTLYQKPGGLPVRPRPRHRARKALCIELPWRGNQGRLFDVRMRVRAARSSCEASAAPSSRGSTRGSSWCTRTTTRSAAPSPVPPSRPRSRVPPRRCRGSR